MDEEMDTSRRTDRIVWVDVKRKVTYRSLMETRHSQPPVGYLDVNET